MAKQQTAQLRHLRIAPRKVRAIADLVKGMSVNEAEAQLVLQPRRPAVALLKLLRSALANAKQNKQLDINLEKLVVASIRVDGGPITKRYLPRARGKADPIQRKTSHVTLTLEEREAAKPRRFTIARPEKKKKPSAGEARPKKRLVKPEEERKNEQREKPGFFQKIFRRKTV